MQKQKAMQNLVSKVSNLNQKYKLVNESRFENSLVVWLVKSKAVF